MVPSRIPLEFHTIVSVVKYFLFRFNIANLNEKMGGGIYYGLIKIIDFKVEKVFYTALTYFDILKYDLHFKLFQLICIKMDLV